MQELIIFFLIAFAIVGSLLIKSSYSFDDPPKPEKTQKQMRQEQYEKEALLYNIKYHEFPPLYIDHHFGSASGGNKIDQYVIQ